MLDLAVEARDKKQKPDALRESGFIPGVLYGPKEKPVSVSIDATVFEKVWKEAGETAIVNISGLDSKKDVLIHSVDIHPVTGVPLHVDFYAVIAGQQLDVNIPIEFEGESPAEKVGGVVVKVHHELSIKVAPADLPQHFTVDLGKLENIGDHITAGEIDLPKSAVLNIDENETIVSITEAKEEEPEEVEEEEVEEVEGAEGETPAESEEEKTEE